MKGDGMTMLTWCEECGDDMHENGGRMCQYCGGEYCYRCIKEHERTCSEKDVIYQKCSYCGNYHTYSLQMCRDMTLRNTQIPSLKEFEAAMDEVEDRAMANSGMEAYVKGLIVEDKVE